MRTTGESIRFLSGHIQFQGLSLLDRCYELTVFGVEYWVVLHICAILNDIVIKFIPSCEGSDPRTREFAEWVEVQTMDHMINKKNCKAYKARLNEVCANKMPQTGEVLLLISSIYHLSSVQSLLCLELSCQVLRTMILLSSSR